VYSFQRQRLPYPVALVPFVCVATTQLHISPSPFENSTILLECTSELNADTDIVSWSKDGKPLDFTAQVEAVTYTLDYSKYRLETVPSFVRVPKFVQAAAIREVSSYTLHVHIHYMYVHIHNVCAYVCVDVCKVTPHDLCTFINDIVRRTVTLIRY
jgi:hypothetical protein